MPKIDLDKCKGCGICVDACLNNAITIENKKAAIDVVSHRHNTHHIIIRVFVGSIIKDLEVSVGVGAESMK